MIQILQYLFTIFYKLFLTSLIIFCFACSNVYGNKHPAAFGCPPPPNIMHTSDTFTYSFERSDALKPFSACLSNMET